MEGGREIFCIKAGYSMGGGQRGEGGDCTAVLPSPVAQHR